MKQKQLDELIRQVTRIALREMSSFSTSLGSSLKSASDQDPATDTTTPPTDAMTSAEKARHDRELEHKKQQDLKAKEQELKTAKKESEFQKQKVDQARRFTIPTINKDIQTLKGAKI